MHKINNLHVDSAKRKEYVNSLPAEIYPYILSLSSTGIGANNQLYRGSYDVLMNSLAEKSGGFDKILPKMEETEYSEYIMRDFLTTVANVGEYAKIMPADKSLQEKYMKTFFSGLASTPGQIASFSLSVNSLLKNPKTRESAENAMFSSYESTLQTINDNPGDKYAQNSKEIMQYWMLDNLPAETLKQRGISIDQKVVDVDKRLTIPVDDWIKNAEREDGVPVLKGKVFFTSLDDKDEWEHYNLLKSRAKQFGYAVTSTKTGYMLTKDTEVVSGDRKENVKIEFEITQKLDDVSETLADPKTFFVSNRGHCFQFDDVWNNLISQNTEASIRKIGFLGSCGGGTHVPGLSQKNLDFDFIGTVGTGRGDINNEILLWTMEGIKKGITNYVDLETYIKKNYQGYSSTADLANYQFPKTFAVAQLLK
jgi:hypothetical protein